MELSPYWLRHGTLTPRERDLLRLVVNGYCEQEMVTVLSISLNTVRHLRQRVLDRMEVHSMAAAVYRAVVSGQLEQQTDGPLRLETLSGRHRSLYSLKSSQGVRDGTG